MFQHHSPCQGRGPVSSPRPQLPPPPEPSAPSTLRRRFLRHLLLPVVRVAVAKAGAVRYLMGVVESAVIQAEEAAALHRKAEVVLVLVLLLQQRYHLALRA